MPAALLVGDVTYDALADLSVSVDSVSRERLERDTSSGFTRASTVISLSGEGHTGRGEDVTYDATHHETERWDRVDLDFAGEYTLDSFSDRVGEADCFAETPDREVFRNYRQWGFESAALDLALRQADTTLAERLDRSLDPVRFVVSTRLAAVDDESPPTTDRVDEWLAIDPDSKFKLDPTPDWTPEIGDALAETGAVRILDFKGHYEGTEVETPPDPDLYERLLEAMPETVVEDPALTEETRPLFEGHEHRVSWDAPIHGIDDIEALPFEPDWLNIKPSRFGSVESLLDSIEYCEKRDISLYGGGQFELGVGRDHIQHLAGLFYPDGPNDVAPRGYNAPEPRSGLPSSPLELTVPERGFAPE